MNRRDFIRFAFTTTATATMAANWVCRQTKSDKNHARPNIILIVTDDNRENDFGYLGGNVLTPNIDRLVKEGMLFNKGYVSSPVCTPSRFSIITGKYASRCKHPTFKRDILEDGLHRVLWNTYLTEDTQTLPGLLQDQGYVTGICGKWHLSDLGWEELRDQGLHAKSDPFDQEVDRKIKQNQQLLQERVKKYGFDYAAAIHENNVKGFPAFALQHHNQEWITHGALNFIEQNRDRPFFLYMATTLLHGPPPIDSLKADPRLSIGGILDKSVIDSQPSRQSVLQRVADAGLPEHSAPATWLDDSIGVVYDKLVDSGLADNTILFFINDHGIPGKGSLYEGGVHTQMFIYGQGHIKPGETNILTQNIDITPTLLDFAGVEIQEHHGFDGISLRTFLENQADIERDSLYFEMGLTRGILTANGYKYIAFRVPPSAEMTKQERIEMVENQRKSMELTNRLHFLSWLKLDPDGPVTHLGSFPGGTSTEQNAPMRHYSENYFDRDQLYYIPDDPEEKQNLAEQPEYQDILADLKTRLQSYLDKVPGTYPL